MFLDLKTMLVCDCLTTAFLGFALLFYAVQHKTYPGVGFWIAGIFAAGIGHAALLLRVISPIWLSIFVANACFLLAAIFRLDGTRRFLRQSRLPVSMYVFLAPILSALTVIGFYVILDDIIIRNLISSSMICILTMLIAGEFLRSSPGKRKTVALVAAWLNGILGLEIMIRAVIWTVHSDQDMMFFMPFRGGHYFVIMLYEVGWGITCVMMNSQRLEEDLMDSQQDLRDSVEKLEKAFSEIKTLSGLIPICASCKKIRDDKGFWNQIELYIHEHSDASFSHGFCPDCLKKLYPELDEEET